jgi:hypothetical protein
MSTRLGTGFHEQRECAYTESMHLSHPFKRPRLEVAEGPLHRSDRTVLESFLALLPGANERLEIKGGRSPGVDAIAVLWLDGQPVASAHRLHKGEHTHAFVGVMNDNAFASAARQYLFECSGQHAQVRAEPDSGPIQD